MVRRHQRTVKGAVPPGRDNVYTTVYVYTDGQQAPAAPTKPVRYTHAGKPKKKPGALRRFGRGVKRFIYGGEKK